jgi:hypothetical protein
LFGGKMELKKRVLLMIFYRAIEKIYDNQGKKDKEVLTIVGMSCIIRSCR